MKTREKNKVDLIFDAYEKEIENFTVSPILGSCQYKSIEDTYNWATDLIEVLGLKGFEIMLGIKYSRALTQDEVEHMLWEILSDSIDNEQKSWLEDDEMLAPFETMLSSGKCTIEDYTHYTKNLAWDLWSAEFSPLLDESIENPISLPTYGPILNQMAQSDNFLIGIHLAYINHLYGVDLSEWANYDT